MCLYLFATSVYADCPAGESIGNYPLSSPLILCVSYIGNNCVAQCGYSPSSEIAACVQNSGNNGPYRLTGVSCTPEPGSTVDCSLTPYAAECFTDPVDCTATPNDPSCSSGGSGAVDCTVTPNDPSCSTGGGSTGGGSTGGAIADTGGASCGSGVGCTFNPKGYAVSSDSDYGMHQIHDVLDSLTVVTTYSDNLANNTLLSISDSVNSLQNETKTNLTNLYNQSLSTNNLLDSIKSGIASIPNDSPIDYSGLLNSINQNTSTSAGMSYTIYYGLNGTLSGLHSMISSNLSVSNSLQDKQLQKFNEQIGLLGDIKSLLSNSASGSGGTGSGGGEGSGTGPSVGTADNPTHVASSLYKACTDCVVDVAGAQSELDASKEKLITVTKQIQSDFKNIFTFDSSAGSGSSSISSCWDFGSLIGQKCMQLDETWALLKALVLFIFMIAVVFMFTRGN
jgi:hypothetical protein